MRASLIVIVLIFVFILDVNSQNACIWGRAQNYNDAINGEYTYQGYFNSAPWFTKQYIAQDASPVTVYLWRSPAAGYANRYFITNVPPHSNAVFSFASCSIQTNTPWECGLNWQVYDGFTFVFDMNVYSQQGSCPEWDCYAIDSAVNTPKCNDIFPKKIGPNAWTNSAGDWYFYFHPLVFRWLCDVSYEADNFNYQIGSSDGKSIQGWTDISQGSSLNVQFTAPCCDYFLIKCIADPTLQPTISPTMPSMQPTLAPTSPTAIPTRTPTNNPTIVPSNIPTVEPTSDPTNIPTNIPTTDPTNIPTNIPTIHPTNDPSNNPTGGPTVDLNDRESSIEIETTINVTNEVKARSDVFHSLSITMYIIFVLAGGIVLLAVCSCICGYKMFKKRRKSFSKNVVELTKRENVATLSSNSVNSTADEHDEESRSAEKLYSGDVGSMSSITKNEHTNGNEENICTHEEEDIMAEELYDTKIKVTKKEEEGVGGVTDTPGTPH